MNSGEPLKFNSMSPQAWTDAAQQDAAAPVATDGPYSPTRVLVDISQALWERAGIPQAARQLVSILSGAPGVNASAFIMSIHDATAADRFRGKSSPHQSMIEDAEFLADALGQHQRKRVSPLKYIRKYFERFTDLPYPLIPIRKGSYDDVIWENYFAPGLGAHSRSLLPLTAFYRSPLTRRESTRRLRRRRRSAQLDASAFDFVIFQNPSPIRVSSGAIKIIRCHDLVPLLRFDTQPISRHLIRDFHTVLSQCVKDSFFACVSESTRDELVSFYPDATDRAFVIPNSVTLPAGRAGTGAGTPAPSTVGYFLAVGTIEPRKNYCRLLDAFRTFRLAQPDSPRLLLVGNTGWRNEKELREIKLAVEEGWLEWHKEVSPDRLVEFYRGASALICASVHEGFGIPPIEAAAIGTPSVLSDLTVFRTHFGDDAEYFDPYDPASMVQALARLTPTRSAQLRARVGQTAQRFGSERELALWQDLFARLAQRKSAAS